MNQSSWNEHFDYEWSKGDSYVGVDIERTINLDGTDKTVRLSKMYIFINSDIDDHISNKMVELMEETDNSKFDIPSELSLDEKYVKRVIEKLVYDYLLNEGLEKTVSLLFKHKYRGKRLKNILNKLN